MYGPHRGREGRARRLREAEKAYTAYLDKPEHKPHLREEEMDLRLALGTAKHRPERAIPLLQNLALRHRFAATGAGARRALESLREAGHEGALVPTDIQSQMLLAESLRRSGWVDRAWALFHEIEAQGEGNPKVTAWIAQSRSSFARSTRHPIPGTSKPWPSTAPGCDRTPARPSKAGGRLGAGTRPQSGVNNSRNTEAVALRGQ